MNASEIDLGYGLHGISNENAWVEVNYVPHDYCCGYAGENGVDCGFGCGAVRQSDDPL